MPVFENKLQIRVPADSPHLEVTDGTDTATFIFGSGTPEGVVTANPGSTYQDATGKMWFKASGTGNTGWTQAGDALKADPLSQFAATTSAQLRGVISDETGTGSLVFATSPALVTPDIGTPSAGTLTSCTGLPISTGVSGLASNVATFLGTPSSANLASAVTDETGSGALVFGTNPTIAKPVMSVTNPTRQDHSPISGGTATLDLSVSSQHFVNFPAGNITLAISNATNHQIFTVSLTQDGTGSRTVTWFATIRWAGGTAPTLTTTANKRDVFIFMRTGANTYDGFIVGLNV